MLGNGEFDAENCCQGKQRQIGRASKQMGWIGAKDLDELVLVRGHLSGKKQEKEEANNAI